MLLVLILPLHVMMRLIVRADHMTKTVPRADAHEPEMTNSSLLQ
jgi:type IV secretory pathway VirB3-like protein